MRRKIFFDANVLIDLINAANGLNKQTIFLFSQLEKEKKVFYCSPTSFSITYYFLGKIIKNKKLLNSKIVDLFSNFVFTKENSEIMNDVMNSQFKDLEDALQYFSALDSDVDFIITKNFYDFDKPSIPVYHPLHFINEFLIN
ncbi:MAG: type II toxin-antitoxin system VapC family toxin [Ginsengibacter sp.]